MNRFWYKDEYTEQEADVVTMSDLEKDEYIEHCANVLRSTKEELVWKYGDITVSDVLAIEHLLNHFDEVIERHPNLSSDIKDLSLYNILSAHPDFVEAFLVENYDAKPRNKEDKALTLTKKQKDFLFATLCKNLESQLNELYEVLNNGGYTKDYIDDIKKEIELLSTLGYDLVARDYQGELFKYLKDNDLLEDKSDEMMVFKKDKVSNKGIER